jgi:hypothetical protein
MWKEKAMSYRDRMKEDAMIERTFGIALGLGLAAGATFAIAARAAGVMAGILRCT